MRILLFAILCLVACTLAWAAEPLRVENKAYSFAFTFEQGTELTYEADGVGISGSHLPAGAKRADYGILVYGSPAMSLSAAEAKAAGLGSEEMILDAAEIADAAQWVEAFTAIMVARNATQAGSVTVKAAGGELTIPYYTWTQNVLGRTRHALMYVVKHGDAFIYVQVESNQELSKSRKALLAAGLELL
jgi:hypothetical protein